MDEKYGSMMLRRSLLLSSFLTFTALVFSQPIDTDNYRTYDGSVNNLDNLDWGAAGTNLLRVTDIGYDDGISSPGGTTRPNPREVSNALFAQENSINDPLSLSDFCWVWGQFIDHDIGITGDSEVEPAMISVPMGDPWFDPLGEGQAVIPMMRNIYDPTSGTSTFNPREHPNEITAFIDGSAIYGSDEERADWLRTFTEGKLKTSEGDLLPYNTITGELDDAIDPDAPGMANATGISDKIFVAGDVRANENPLLLSFHTLFVREHNRLCEMLIEEHPDWDDESIYQHARKMVGGFMQAVVYEEWLPAMGVDLPAYTNYDETVNPGLMNVFSGAAYRLGHTLLNSQIMRVNDNGEEIPEGHLMLRDGFFNPLVIPGSGGIAPFIKGMATQVQQGLDPKVVNDVRNFLFGPPGAGGLDLASININRGRERGLPHYNKVRENFGLQPYHFFQQINTNPVIYTQLLSLYNNLNDIDVWVGLLAEEPMPGALFGETIMVIMEHQFKALRDGDRFYYEADPVLSDEEKTTIKNTTLHDIIMRNTGISLMQDDVFSAMPHSEICENMTVEITGNIATEEGVAISDVIVSVTSNLGNDEWITDDSGLFSFSQVPGCEVDQLLLLRDDDASNGVSTFDIIHIQKHILGAVLLNSPYKIIAADIDHSGLVTTIDLVKMRRVILGIDDHFEDNTSWRFVKADYEFMNPADPLAEDFPELIDFGGILSSNLSQPFIGIKIGDVNGSVDPNGLLASDLEVRNQEDKWQILVEDMDLIAGNSYTLMLQSGSDENIEGFQMGIQYNPSSLQLAGVAETNLEGLSENNFGLFPTEGQLRTSWNGTQRILTGETLFSLEFVALRNGRLSDWISIEKEKMEAAVYDNQAKIRGINLLFEEVGGSQDVFTLYQNRPNPFRETTLIPFELTRAGTVEIKIFDSAGRTLLFREGEFDAGYNELTISHDQLSISGVLYYQLATPGGTAVRKMVLTE